MTACRACGAGVEPGFRFCPWCAAPQRRKLVEFFRPHPLVEREGGRALRVSRYLGFGYEERHVRLSLWSDEGVAESALSLDDAEAERLGRFLLDTSPHSRPSPAPRARLWTSFLNLLTRGHVSKLPRPGPDPGRGHTGRVGDYPVGASTGASTRVRKSSRISI